MGRVCGYIRVSHKDQNLERQRRAMQDAGVDEKLIFEEKQTGKDFDRPQYQLLKRILGEGDVLIILDLDRLGRNYEQIRNEWRELTEAGVGIRVLDMPLLDTSITKDLIGKFIADMVLQVLSFVAEREYHSIRERQRQGIEAARLKGVAFGRKRIAMPNDFEAIVKKWRGKEISFVEAKALSGLSRTKFYEFAKGIGVNDHKICDNAEDN